MRVYRNIGLNFVGNAWNGALILFTTPWYISMLGLEGYGLVGFWQLLLYVFLVFDFGLGASLVREFATYRGVKRRAEIYRELLFLVERVCLVIAVALASAIYYLAPVIASSWLRLEGFSPEEVELALRFMSLSIAAQLMSSVYFNGLAGLQKHGALNLIQMFGHGLRYLGGGMVLFFDGGIVSFFAYQGIALLGVTLLIRGVLLWGIGSDQHHPELEPRKSLLTLVRYSVGMFVTALLGMLLSNMDKVMLSKLMPTEDFGRYALALAASGFLQMIVFAFYRSYFPMFSELRATGEIDKLRSVYYEGCRLVGMVIVPATALGWVFSDHLILIWIGREDLLTSEIFRWLILGTACAGLMWIPAAYQQASGWTSLHTSLMAVALAVGAPCALFAIDRFGPVGATSLMLVHGVIEITLGLWLMNRVMFPGDNLKWYRDVLLVPLAISLPLAAISKQLMPEQLPRMGAALWIGATCLICLVCMITLLNKFPLTKKLTTGSERVN